LNFNVIVYAKSAHDIPLFCVCDQHTLSESRIKKID